jgi:hypothetical protein
VDTLLPPSVVDVLPRVRQALGRPRNVIVIDASRGSPVAITAHFRAWLEGGMRLVALIDRDWRRVDNWLGEDTKLLLVLQQGQPLEKSVHDLIDDLDARWYAIIGIDSKTEIVIPSVEPPPEYVDDWHEQAARTSLELTGATTQPAITPAIFPMKLQISSRHADQFSAQFAIAGRGLDFSAGQTVWFRMIPGFEGILLIDRVPGLSGDTWRLEIRGTDGTAGTTLNQTVPVSPDTETNPLELLAVVLDRTCPDNASWKRAFDLVFGKAADDMWASAPDLGTGDQAPAPESYNADVRDGLVEGLRAAFEAGLLRRTQTWWFKDAPGDELANFVGGMYLARPEIEQAGSARAAGECRELFAIAGYSPGLDLWDPVEQALEQSCDALEKSRVSLRAILIVGNSPPTDPTQADSPLAGLRTPPGARMACTTRRQSPGWHDALARCAGLGIPVIYLFLRHTKFGGIPQLSVETYEQSQNRVQNALAGTVALEPARAERDDIRAAVVRTIRALRVQAGLASRVELRLLGRSSR